MATASDVLALSFRVVSFAAADATASTSARPVLRLASKAPFETILVPLSSAFLNESLDLLIPETASLTLEIVTSEKVVLATQEISIASVKKGIAAHASGLFEGSITSSLGLLSFAFTSRDASVLESRRRQMQKRATIQTVDDSSRIKSDKKKEDKKEEKKEDKKDEKKEEKREKKEEKDDKDKKKLQRHSTTREKSKIERTKSGDSKERKAVTKDKDAKSPRTTPEKDKDASTKKSRSVSTSPRGSDSESEGDDEAKEKKLKVIPEVKGKRKSTQLTELHAVKLKKRNSDTDLKVDLTKSTPAPQEKEVQIPATDRSTTRTSGHHRKSSRPESRSAVSATSSAGSTAGVETLEQLTAKLQLAEKALAEKDEALRKEVEKNASSGTPLATHSSKAHKHTDEPIPADLKLADLPKQLEALSSTKTQVRLLIETLGSIQAFQDEIAVKFTDMKKALAVKEAELKASERRAGSLEEELKTAKKASAHEAEFLREEVASSQRDLELAINDFEVELEELRTANRSLKLDYIAERDEVDSLLADIKKVEERLHDTEKDLDDETERASAAADEKARLEAKVAQLTEQLGSKEQLSSKLQVVENEKGTLGSKIKELEQQIRTLNESVEEQTRTSEKHRRAAERIEVRLKETDNEREGLAAKLHETETKLRSAEKLIRDKEGDLESKDRSTKRLEEKMAKLEKEQSELEGKHRTGEEQIKTLQKQLREKDVQVEQTRPRSGSKRQIEEFATNIQAEKELLSRKVADLEKKVQEKEEELNKAKALAASAPSSPAVAPANGSAAVSVSASGGDELEKLRELVKVQEAEIKKAVMKGKIEQMKAEKHRREEIEKSHKDSTQSYELHLTKLRAEMSEIQAKAKTELEQAEKAAKEKKEVEELQNRTRLCLEDREQLLLEVFQYLDTVDKGAPAPTQTKALLAKKPKAEDFRKAKEKLQPAAIFTRYGTRVKQQ